MAHCRIPRQLDQALRCREPWAKIIACWEDTFWLWLGGEKQSDTFKVCSRNSVDIWVQAAATSLLEA